MNEKQRSGTCLVGYICMYVCVCESVVGKTGEEGEKKPAMNFYLKK